MSTQSWFRRTWGPKNVEQFLAKAPEGAFVVRDVPDAPGDFALTLKAGGKMRNMLLKRSLVGSKQYWNVHPTKQYFAHLFDLVAFCHREPFRFEGGLTVPLNIKAVRQAEEMHRVSQVFTQ